MIRSDQFSSMYDYNLLEGDVWCETRSDFLKCWCIADAALAVGASKERTASPSDLSAPAEVEWADVTIPVVNIAAIDNGLAFPFKHPEEWRSYPFGWALLPQAHQPFTDETIEKILPLLDNAEFVRSLGEDLRQIFKVWNRSILPINDLSFQKDKGFDKKLFEKQLSVMRGQIFNLREALRTKKSPYQLVMVRKHIKIYIFPQVKIYRCQHSTWLRWNRRRRRRRRRRRTKGSKRGNSKWPSPIMTNPTLELRRWQLVPRRSLSRSPALARQLQQETLGRGPISRRSKPDRPSSDGGDQNQGWSKTKIKKKSTNKIKDKDKVSIFPDSKVTKLKAMSPKTLNDKNEALSSPDQNRIFTHLLINLQWIEAFNISPFVSFNQTYSAIKLVILWNFVHNDDSSIFFYKFLRLLFNVPYLAFYHSINSDSSCDDSLFYLTKFAFIRCPKSTVHWNFYWKIKYLSIFSCVAC